MRDTWQLGPLRDLDVEEMEPKIQEFTIKANQLMRANAGDQVVSQLLEEIATFKAGAPLLMMLGNRALEERHWQQVWARLGDENDGDPHPYLHPHLTLTLTLTR